jgi:hypothetical protein
MFHLHLVLLCNLSDRCADSAIPEQVDRAFYTMVLTLAQYLFSFSFVCSDPNGKQLASLIGPTDSWPHDWPGLADNPGGGKSLHFRYGRLISSTFQSPPVLIYGPIYNYWKDISGLNSGLGYPLADPQYLDDGSICSVFQGGHVHQFGSRDPEM